MNFQPLHLSTMPCDPHGMIGRALPAHRVEIRWFSLVTRKYASRTAGFVIG
jgi:hypothetical protein